MANNIGLIMATRHDRQAHDFIVLERLTEDYELVGTEARRVDPEKKIAEHMKQTVLRSGTVATPIYRKVWFVPISIPK